MPTPALETLDPATPTPARRSRYLIFLWGAFAVWWAFWAVRPKYLTNWTVENTLLVALLALLFATRRRFPLSNVSYTLIVAFLTLHTVGAHYSYSEVPYNQWFEAAFGRKLNDGRNHYDRLVHFSFGFFLAYPIREMFLRIAGARGFWGYYLPLDVTMSFSMIYELIEWTYAVIAGGDAGAAFLGTQGDQWDAHKDTALATLGALIAMAVVACINWKFDRRFGDEMRESLRVKGAPLGEVKLSELRTNTRREP